MKKSILVLLLICTMTTQADNDLLITPSDFPEPIATNLPGPFPLDIYPPFPAGRIEYPIYYNVESCTFDFNINCVNGSFLASAELSLASQRQCIEKTQYLLLDNHGYVLNDLPDEDEELFIDYQGIADIVWIKQTLTGCHTQSGLPVDTSSDNTPVLVGTSFVFNMAPNQNEFINTDLFIAYRLKSTNGDIVCDNTTLIPAIFENGFER